MQDLTPLGADITETGATFSATMTFEQWAECGMVLGEIERRLNWVIGDWLHEGERREFKASHGEKYSKAIERTGFSYKYLQDIYAVTDKKKIPCRHGKLSFSHHREVLPLGPKEQKKLLAKAEREGWSRSALRRAIQIKRVIESTNGKVSRELVGTIHVGDWRDLIHDIPPESTELIFTDPPYFTEFVEHYGTLAEHALRILIPGGSLIAYCGHALLPDIIAKMSIEGLRYYWVCACVHTGNKITMPLTGQKVGFKPIVWFIKGGQRFDTGAIVEDTIISQPEKDGHDWQQSELDASNFIKPLKTSSGLVVDPFCGHGTTAAVCKRLGRRWFTCELDKETAKQAAERLDGIS